MELGFEPRQAGPGVRATEVAREVERERALQAAVCAEVWMWCLEIWKQNRAQPEVARPHLKWGLLEAGGGLGRLGEGLGQGQGLGGGLVLRGLGL